MKTNKDWFRVLIVGCGQLGSRHLQAVASLPEVREIEVVDPRPEAFELGRQRLAELPNGQCGTIFRWIRSVEEASKDGDLCVVTTQADVRCQVVYQVVDTLQYSSFLLEKLVAQSVLDYENLLEFSKKKGLAVWVNCKTRVHPSHMQVKAHIDPAKPIIFSVVGGNHGLVNNGIQAADLFAYYDGANQIESAGAWIDPILHYSKRGRGLFDLSGSLNGYSEKGSRVAVCFAADHDMRPIFWLAI